VETRRLFVDLFNKTEDIEKTISDLQANHYNLIHNVKGFKEMVVLQGSLTADISRPLYISNVYFMHFLAFQDCRSGRLNLGNEEGIKIWNILKDQNLTKTLNKMR